jgi:hypothetical protein
MARRYDPRYDVNQGYAAGDAMVKLSQLLRQGVGDYRQAGLDEDAQKNKQDDYLLRLQQMLGAQEDRDLNRDLAYGELGRRTAADQQAAADRAAGAATAASGRSGLARLLKMPSTVEEESAPPPEFAGDPERMQPNILQALVKRPRTRDEAMTGLSPEEAGHTDVFDRLMKLYPTPEKPKAPEPFTLGQGQTRFDPAGKPIAAKPESPEKAPTPSAERDYHAMARARLGPDAPEAALGAEVRRLALADQKEIAGVRSDATLRNQMTMLDQRDLVTRGRQADEASAELAQVKTILGKMEEIVPKVNAPGLLGRAAGLTTRKVEEYAQTNPEINRLAAMGEGYISVIAKIVQRQSGILSNQDLTRAEKSVPQVSDRLEVAQNKLKDLRDILNTAEQNIERLRGGKGASTPTPAGSDADAEANAYLKKHGY